MEKFEDDNNTECEYDDKIIRTQDPTSGSTLVDCLNSNLECNISSFEANDPCIKNNFIDKRCKLIKIWFAKQVKDSYYMFSDDDKHTHIIQMKRDANLNCLQFGDNDAQLISYLNSLHKSQIKNNTLSFTTEEEISTYNDGNPNSIDKLIIGYAYGDNDTKTQSKQLDDMNVCINFESKFNNDDGIFIKKALLKDETAEKTFFNPVVDTNEKTVNTGIKTLKRYIKKLSNGKYTIVYGNSDTNKISDSNEVSVDNTNTIDLNAEKPELCSSIVKKPDLWILHSDEKYHRVEFTDPLFENTTKCQTIKDPNKSGSKLPTYNNSLIKTERELLNYIEMDETKDVFKLNFDFNDKTKWFKREVDVFGNVHLTSHNVKSCGVNEYESSAPQTKDTLDIN